MTTVARSVQPAGRVRHHLSGRMRRAVRPARTLCAYLLLAAPAMAGEVPTLDTEEATLGAAKAGDGRWHPLLGVDLRNGDFARGNYDDDPASLDRLPAHLRLGLAIDLDRGHDGAPDRWLVLTSNNGFHSPSAAEPGNPRFWYESNNLAAFVATLAPGLRGALVYTVKTSPNGVSGVSNEASLSFRYSRAAGFGALHPTFAVTLHPVQGRGQYTLFGIAPSHALGASGFELGLKAGLGIGWGGFYQAGSGNRVFGDAGLSLSHPVRLGRTTFMLRAEALALVRDDRLRALSAPYGETGTVVPLATIGLSWAN